MRWENKGSKCSEKVSVDLSLVDQLQGITCELVRDAKSQAPTHPTRTCIKQISSGGLCAQESLESTALKGCSVQSQQLIRALKRMWFLKMNK